MSVIEATEGDRQRAIELLPDHQGWCHAAAHGDCCGADDCDCGTSESRDAVAMALAYEREKARAPFLALAEEWVRDESVDDPTDVLIWATFKSCANQVRRAAEESE